MYAIMKARNIKEEVLSVNIIRNAVEQWASETGAAGVRLVSGGSRADAHAFYRHCGYVDGKEQLNFKKML